MSRWAGACVLVAQKVERDGYGVGHAVERRRKVPCNVRSMGDASYFAAAAAGVHPEAVLQLRRALYNGERVVEFEGRELSVERVNRSSPDFVTLTLVERIGNRGRDEG